MNILNGFRLKMNTFHIYIYIEFVNEDMATKRLL